MTAPTPPILRLDSLPSEIQDLVVDHVISDLTREELKTFRQATRYFRDRANDFLFSTLHVSASSLSIKRLIQVAQAPRLASHVREIVFHRGTFSGHRMCRMYRGHLEARDYGDFEAYVVRNPEHARLLPRVSAAYVAFVEEVQAEIEFHRDASWQSIIRQSLGTFTNLAKLTTMSSDADTGLSTYFTKRCGLRPQTSTPDYFAPYEIFQAVGPGFRPRALSLQDVNGEDLAEAFSRVGKTAASFQDRFANLVSFKLSFSETEPRLDPTIYARFFENCSNLRELDLDLSFWRDERIVKDTERFHQQFLVLMLNQTWPNLLHLVLKVPFMSEDDFIAFFVRHASTLRALHIEDWRMPVNQSMQLTGSFIRTFYRLANIPKPYLKHVMFSGRFTNRETGAGWELLSKDQQQALDQARQDTALHRMLDYVKYGTKAQRIPEWALESALFQTARSTTDFRNLDAMPNKLGNVDITFYWNGPDKA